jgi:hypothetical protein
VLVFDYLRNTSSLSFDTTQTSKSSQFDLGIEYGDFIPIYPFMGDAAVSPARHRCNGSLELLDVASGREQGYSVADFL